MSDELTLEKIKVVERLHGIELEMSKLNDTLNHLNNTLVKIEHEVWGNGKEGLKTHVDRLRQGEERRSWGIRTLWVGFLGVIFKLIYDIFR